MKGYFYKVITDNHSAQKFFGCGIATSVRAAGNHLLIANEEGEEWETSPVLRATKADENNKFFVTLNSVYYIERCVAEEESEPEPSSSYEESFKEALIAHFAGRIK